MYKDTVHDSRALCPSKWKQVISPRTSQSLFFIFKWKKKSMWHRYYINAMYAMIFSRLLIDCISWAIATATATATTIIIIIIIIKAPARPPHFRRIKFLFFSIKHQMAFDNYNIFQSEWVPLNYGHANVLSVMLYLNRKI